MKTIALIVIAYLPLLIYSQANPSFEMYITPSYTHYTNNIINDEAAITYNFGVGVNLPKTEYLTWTMGLRFSDFATKYSNDNLRWGSQHDGNGGFDPNLPPGEEITGISFRSHHFYLEMPLGIKYGASKNRWHFFVEPTINPAYFFGERDDIEKRYESRPDEQLIQNSIYDNIREFNVFGELGFGLGFDVSEKIRIDFRPSGKIQLMSLAKNSYTNPRFYSTGIKLGMNYQIK